MMLKIMRYSYSIMIKYTQKYEEKLTLFNLKDLAKSYTFTLKLCMVL